MFNEQRLDSITELIADCPHSTPTWTNSGIIVLRNQNIRNGKLNLSTPSFTDEEHYIERVQRAVPTENDIVLTREAPMGEVCVIPHGLKCCLGQRMVLIRPDEKQVNGKYLFYALQSPYLKHQINWNEGTGSTVSNIRIPFIKKFNIPLPERRQQDEIASILSSLDDKIELNRKMNETLEEMARAIFKSWFVDFDPVYAKARGEKPAGMPDEIADLFPSEFVHSDLLGKPIPKGWTVKPLKELIDFNPTRKLQKGSVVPYVEMSGLPEHGMSIKNFYEREFNSGSKFVNGDTLFARITPCLENGKTAFVDCLKDSEVGWGSTEFIVMRSKAGIPSFFSYLVARSEWFRTVAIASMTGSSGRQRASKEALEELLVAVPSVDVFKAFNDIIEKIPEKIKSAHNESQTLAELRDSLLPKLISGEIEV